MRFPTFWLLATMLVCETVLAVAQVGTATINWSVLDPA
jgi:hypothetical protein